MLEIKQQLITICESKINEQLNTLQNRLDLIEEARNSETKSSVGDKHNTGRAMMQLEEENINHQIAQVLETKRQLSAIPSLQKAEQVQVGSLIICSNATYFIAVGMGKVILKDERYFCISKDAPIGQILIGKKEKETITFNNKTWTIQSIH